jgi:CRP-like cAMP-binding protein
MLTDHLALRSPSPLLRRLNAMSPLSADEIALVASASRRLTFPAGATLFPHTSATSLQFVLSGWVCAQRLLPDGRRQLYNVALPGDDVECAGPSVRCEVIALTAVTMLDGGAVRAAMADPASFPGLARAFSVSKAQAVERLFDHVLRLGRLSAREAVLDLMTELRDRLEVVGLVSEQGFPFPLTQEALADLLGLSGVHVNRTLGQLRREGRLILSAGRAKLMDLDLPPARTAASPNCSDVEPALRRTATGA